MCGIIASFSLDKLKQIAELNSYRGQHSYSLALFDYEMKELFYLCKDFGPINFNNFGIPPSNYAIAHIQAPTSENRDLLSIHPAQYGNTYLWHNGILKPETIKKLQKELNSSSTWDTQLLLEHIVAAGRPRDIDGSFACLLIDEQDVYIFRNEIAPLFYDDLLNVSSVPFAGSKTVPPNIMWGLGLNTRELIETDRFETVDCPYIL